MEENLSQENQEQVNADEYIEELIQESLPININVDNVQNFTYDADKFKKGIDDMSELVGKFTALRMSGVPIDTIHEILLSEMTINMNIELAKIDVEKAKCQALQNPPL